MKLYSICAILLSLAAAGSVTAQSGARARINHVAIYVMDLKKSGDFYMNVIGLDSIPEPFHDGKHLWLNIGPGSSMHIIQGSDSIRPYYKNHHTCFTVPSVDAFTQLLKIRNINWEDVAGRTGAITNRIDGVKQIWLQDPDGYWIEINDAKD